MRYYKRLKVFKSKRCWFDPYEMVADSYDWWRFVECRQRYGVIFNDSSYSMQTGVQQYTIKTLLKKLGVKYKTVYVRCGLQNIQGEINNKKFEIKEYKEAIKKPRTWKKTNKRRISWIAHLEREIVRLKKLDAAKTTTYKKPLDWTILNKEEKEKQRLYFLKNKDKIKKKEFRRDFDKLINSEDKNANQ